MLPPIIFNCHPSTESMQRNSLNRKCSCLTCTNWECGATCDPPRNDIRGLVKVNRPQITWTVPQSNIQEMGLKCRSFCFQVTTFPFFFALGNRTLSGIELMTKFDDCPVGGTGKRVSVGDSFKSAEHNTRNGNLPFFDAILYEIWSVVVLLHNRWSFTKWTIEFLLNWKFRQCVHLKFFLFCWIFLR